MFISNRNLYTQVEGCAVLVQFKGFYFITCKLLKKKEKDNKIGLFNKYYLPKAYHVRLKAKFVMLWLMSFILCVCVLEDVTE